MKKTLLTLGAAASAASLAFASPALAGSVEVRTSDLNLATVAGQETLDRRISAAAKKACGVASSHSKGALFAAKAKRCAVQAKARALQAYAASDTDAGRTG